MLKTAIEQIAKLADQDEPNKHPPLKVFNMQVFSREQPQFVCPALANSCGRGRKRCNAAYKICGSVVKSCNTFSEPVRVKTAIR